MSKLRQGCREARYERRFVAFRGRIACDTTLPAIEMAARGPLGMHTHDGLVGARAEDEEAIHPTDARSREVYRRVLPPPLPTTFANCATTCARESARPVCVRAHVFVRQICVVRKITHVLRTSRETYLSFESV